MERLVISDMSKYYTVNGVAFDPSRYSFSSWLFLWFLFLIEG